MRRAVLTFLTALLVLGGAMSPASAETGSVTDPSGDGPAVVDITRLTVRNGNHRFTMRVKVRDLRQRGTFGFHYWGGASATPPARSALVVVRRVDGETKASFLACDREECHPARCRATRVEWRPARDVVEVSVRQRCYPRPPRNPDAPAPAVGRFFAEGVLGEEYDSTDLLTLQRG